MARRFRSPSAPSNIVAVHLGRGQVICTVSTQLCLKCLTCVGGRFLSSYGKCNTLRSIRRYIVPVVVVNFLLVVGLLVYFILRR